LFSWFRAIWRHNWNGMTVHQTCLLFVMATFVTTVAAQTPQPFPRGGQPAAKPVQPAPQPPSIPVPRTPTSGTGQTPPIQTPATSASDSAAPSAAQLGFPVYPNAQYVTSYDAGRGQRYYLFGTTAAFAELVQYYRTTLKEKGNLVFEQPPTHMFEVGRFREETMAFPPGVTIKDYAAGGSGGYPNPTAGAQPARFATIIQIVPAPPPATPTRR
jgi:hypothetical protein